MQGLFSLRKFLPERPDQEKREIKQAWFELCGV
jgi:hypothetical protein